MKKAIQKSVLYLLLLGFTNILYGNDIIYPWRAAKVMVQQDHHFEILFRNTTAASIDSIILQGPFNRVRLKVDSVVNGYFEFDNFTKAAVNNKIYVHVPLAAPEELYDLIIKRGGETSVSPKSVKVVREFRKRHSFIHISDLHLSRQWEGTPGNGYAKELELLDQFIKVANIIAPDFIMITGDNIHQYTMFNADSTGWGGEKSYGRNQRPTLEEKWRNFYEGAAGFAGVHGFNAPVFTLPGNHDYYGSDIKKDYQALSRQWNDLCGRRVYGFSYGDTRVITVDDFLGDPVIDIPVSSPMSGLQGKVLESFLKENGSGRLRIMAQHTNLRCDTMFLNKHRINILLHGHLHTPHDEYIGTTPTLSTRPGTVCRSGVLDAEGELGLFRIFYIDGDTYTFTAPVRFTDTPKAPYDKMKLNLTLDYSRPNNGSAQNNTATIRNSLGIDLPACHIRFVMKKGKYKINGGEIYQIIESGPFSIVDVRVDVGTKEPAKVIITRM